MEAELPSSPGLSKFEERRKPGEPRPELPLCEEADGVAASHRDEADEPSYTEAPREERDQLLLFLSSSPDCSSFDFSSMGVSGFLMAFSWSVAVAFTLELSS